jgi:hypothetical protein
MNIKGKILDETGGPFPYVNIWINGNPVAYTDMNGEFEVTNLSANDQVKITYQGYGDYTYKASEVPSKIQMIIVAKETAGVWVSTKFIKTPWLLWLGLGIAGTAIYAYNDHQKSKKIVKAKI